jgi:hypothetical protein
MAVFAESDEDFVEIVQRAETLPGSKTKVHFAERGWVLDGTVFFGRAPFTTAFCVESKEESKVDSRPYMIKLKPAAEELFAFKAICDAVENNFPAEKAKLRALVPSQLVEVTVGGEKREVLAMPHYVRTLDDLPPLPESHVLALVGPLFLVVELMWKCSLFHCDIKPANCFLDSSGSIALGDYGSLQQAEHLDALSTEIFIPDALVQNSGFGKSGESLDAGMLLSTIAQLLGWWHALDRQHLSRAVIEDNHLENEELKSLVGKLFRKVWGA